MSCRKSREARRAVPSVAGCTCDRLCPHPPCPVEVSVPASTALRKHTAPGLCLPGRAAAGTTQEPTARFQPQLTSARHLPMHLPLGGGVSTRCLSRWPVGGHSGHQPPGPGAARGRIREGTATGLCHPRTASRQTPPLRGPVTPGHGVIRTHDTPFRQRSLEPVSPQQDHRKKPTPGHRRPKPKDPKAASRCLNAAQAQEARQMRRNLQKSKQPGLHPTLNRNNRSYKPEEDSAHLIPFYL